MRQHARKILRNIAGGALILLGVIGLFVPILQGILFILLGTAMLDFPGKQRFVARLRSNPLLSPLFRRISLHRSRPSDPHRRDGGPIVPPDPGVSSPASQD